MRRYRWFSDSIIFCLAHISVSLCHRAICFLQQSCLIISTVAYQRSSWDALSVCHVCSPPFTGALISHLSCLLLSTPNPFIRLSDKSPINHSFLSCPIPSLSVLGTVFSCYIHSISHLIHSTLSFSLEVDKCEVCRFVGCFCYCYCCQSCWCHYPMKTQTEPHLGVMKREEHWAD